MGAAFVCLAGGVRADEGERGAYVHVVGAVTAGKSLRFNNPFRLAEPLGKSAESVSTGAGYVDVAVGVFPRVVNGLQHGVWVHHSQAMSGVSQGVFAPSYAALWRGAGAVMPYARVGVPIVTGPEVNLGGELAAGAVLRLTAGLGVTAEAGGVAFYGAATREVEATFVPLLYGQVGVAIDLEVLP